MSDTNPITEAQKMSAAEARRRSGRIFCRIGEDGNVNQVEWSSDDVEPTAWAGEIKEYALAANDDPRDKKLHERLLGKAKTDKALRAVVVKPRFLITYTDEKGNERVVRRIVMKPGEKPQALNPGFNAYEVQPGVHPKNADFKNAKHAAEVHGAKTPPPDPAEFDVYIAVMAKPNAIERKSSIIKQPKGTPLPDGIHPFIKLFKLLPGADAQTADWNDPKQATLVWPVAK